MVLAEVLIDAVSVNAMVRGPVSSAALAVADTAATVATAATNLKTFRTRSPILGPTGRTEPNKASPRGLRCERGETLPTPPASQQGRNPPAVVSRCAHRLPECRDASLSDVTQTLGT